MNSTEKSWTACWTSPGSALRLVNTATGPPRWGPVRFPQRLWFWVCWQFDLSSVVMFVTPLAFKGTLKPDLIYCCNPPQVWMSRIMTWPFRVCLNCSSSRSVRLWPLCRPKSVEVRGHLPSQQLLCRVSPTSPRTCNLILALKHLMKRVLERLMDAVVSVEDDDEEEEEAQQTSTQHHSRVHCSLGTLCDWYSCQTKVRRRSTACVHDLQSAAPKGSDHHHHGRLLKLQKSSSGTPGKKRSSPGGDGQQQPPVVIIFKDLEAFSPKVLQDFILICR